MAHNGKKKHKAVDESECITEPIEPDEQYVSLKKSPEHERRHISEYMESQAPDETITHLEKVTTEAVYGRQYDVWDVHTDKHRWWVITMPTNLYSQDMFRSMDMCLTFHIGLASRLLGADEELDEVSRLLLRAMRRMDAAAEALDDAREIEDFQAVGMKLREALLALVRECADPAMVPSGVDEPKLADFIHWSEYIIDALADNANMDRTRSLLKSLAKDTWQVVNYLTHTTSADRTLAELTTRTVSFLLAQFGALLRANTDEEKERCGNCDSLNIYEDFRDGGESLVKYKVCAVCGSEMGPLPAD
jgi:hypothetical protein